MIGILNYLHIIVLVLTAFAIYSFRSSVKKMLWSGAVGAILLLALQAFTPSYMPKGSPRRVELPAMETSDAVIEDRLSRPDSLEERDARLEEKLDWEQKIKDSKAEAESAKPEEE